MLQSKAAGVLGGIVMLFCTISYSQECDLGWESLNDHDRTWTSAYVSLLFWHDQRTENDATWLGVYQIATSEMNFLGDTQITFNDAGSYAGSGTITESNGVNEFALGSLPDQNAGGQHFPSAKSVCDPNILLGCNHMESDIIMNIDNLDPDIQWGNGSNDTADRGTAIRHEFGHTYGMPHNDSFNNLMYNTIVTGGSGIKQPDACIDAWVNCYYFGTQSECDKLEPPPTPILLAFERAVKKDGHVSITWETKQQIGVLGFDILRSNDCGEVLDLQKVNSQLIEATGDELIGATYEFVDETADPKKSYWYVIKANGSEISESNPFYYLGEASK